MTRLIRTVFLCAAAAAVAGCAGPSMELIPASKVTKSGSPPPPRTVPLPGNVKLEMQGIPKGVFIMGRQACEKLNMEMGHKVTLTEDFWLSKYEITQEQYCAVLNKKNYEHKNFCGTKVSGKNFPVCCVSWEEAKIFADKLNELCQDSLPDGYRFDLPTEAQWEYACRAGAINAFHDNSSLKVTLSTDPEAGKKITKPLFIPLPECENLDKLAWYKANSSAQLHEVGQKKPNAWNLYDMHGNVAEWCKDVYSQYTKTADKISAVNMIDPLVTSRDLTESMKKYFTDSHCLRGGNIFLPPKYMTNWYRGIGLTRQGGRCSGIRLAIVSPTVSKIDTSDTGYYSQNILFLQKKKKMDEIRQQALKRQILLTAELVLITVETSLEMAEIISDAHDQISGKNNSGEFSGSGNGNIRGASSIKTGRTAVYSLYVNGRKVTSGVRWRTNGTSITLNDYGSYARVMAGNPPSSSGAFRTGISAEYQGKRYYKTIRIAK